MGISTVGAFSMGLRRLEPLEYFLVSIVLRRRSQRCPHGIAT